MTQLSLWPDNDSAKDDPHAFKQPTKQLDRVREFMADGKVHTLKSIVKACGGTAASITARLRDLRKQEFGGYSILTHRTLRGSAAYQMAV